jgi:hypothetical protein
MVSIEVRSMTENTSWEGLIAFSDLLFCLVDLKWVSRPFDF